MADSISEGARKLRDALSPRMRGSQLARELGVSQQAVNAWIQGIARPRPEHMARIEELLGIPMQAWVDSGSGEHPAADVEPPTGTHSR